MMYDKIGAAGSVAPSSGLASVPAVLATLLVLFLGADYAANGAMENDGYAQILILPAVAALAAAMGRTGAVVSLGSNTMHRAIVTSSFIAAAVAISMAYKLFESIGNLGAFTFAFVGILTFFLVLSGRKEESTILLATVVGFHLGISHAVNSAMDLSTWAGNSPDLIDVERAAAASAFFAFWAVSIVAGVMMAILFRGKLDSAGNGSWFEDLPNSPGRAMIIAFGLILAVQAIPLLWLGQISDIGTFFEHKYLGSVWAFFTTAVILFVAFCHAERWRVSGIGPSEATQEIFSDENGTALVDGGRERVVEIGYSDGTVWTEAATIDVITYVTSWNPESSGIGNYGGGPMPLTWDQSIQLNSGTPNIEWESLEIVGDVDTRSTSQSVPVLAGIANRGTASALLYFTCDATVASIDEDGNVTEIVAAADIDGYQEARIDAGESVEVQFGWRSSVTGQASLTCRILTPLQLVDDDSFGGGSTTTGVMTWTEPAEEDSLPVLPLLAAIVVAVGIAVTTMLRRASDAIVETEEEILSYSRDEDDYED